MHTLALFAYALAAGLTIAGLAGACFELAFGRRLGFRPPFVTPGRIVRSLAVTIAAGPFMLANEALAAYRAGAIAASALSLCGLAAVVWSAASGMVVVELALLGASLLG
jgi:hypothetical protein